MSVQPGQKNDWPFTRLYNQIFAAQGAPASSGLVQLGAAGSCESHDDMLELPVSRTEYWRSACASTAAESARIKQVRDNGRCGTAQIVQPVAAGADWEACMQDIDNAGLEILLALNANPGALQGRWLSMGI